MWFIIALLVVLIIVAVIGVVLYNTLVRQRNEISNAFNQINVQLTRRHDLIPNLVEVAKRYMAHEQATLVQVTQARNQAVSALEAKNKQGLPDIGKLNTAENVFGQSLGAFYATFESYPDLKADQQMNELREEIASTENRIAFARQHFNDNVTEYNNSTETFPSNVIAHLTGFHKQQWLKIDNIEDKRKDIKVDFS